MPDWLNAKVLDELVKMLPFDTNDPVVSSIIGNIKEYPAEIVEWNAYYSGAGLAKFHNLNNDPKMIDKGLVKQFRVKPAYVKEKYRIDESDIIRLASLSDYARRKTKQELIQEAMDSLIPRCHNRLKWLVFQTILNGAISVNEDGIKFEVDYSLPNIDKYVSVSWASASSAKPVLDIRNLKIDMAEVGYGLKTIISNSYTAGLFCDTTDAKTYNGSSIAEKLAPDNLTKNIQYLLPGVEWLVYDKGYFSTNSGIQGGTGHTYFVPDNKLILLPDMKPGEVIDFVSTPSTHNKDRSGFFLFADDKSSPSEQNPHIDVIMGFNGMPRVRRPLPIFVADVTQTS